MEKLYSNRQLKLFKRILTDFIREYTLITNIKIKVPSVNIESVDKFVSQVKTQFTDYANCNEVILSKIDMLKELDTSKVKIQWVSLHNLFLIVFESSSKLIVFSYTKEQVISNFEAGRKAIATKEIVHPQQTKEIVSPQINAMESTMSLMPMMAGLLPMLQQGNSNGNGDVPQGLDFMNDPMFASLIKETSTSLMKSFEGKEDKLKNINPMDLFNGLISGNPSIDGIDLSGIVGNLQNSINNKINTGELNPDEIKNKAENLMKMLPNEIQEKLN
jgi:hypothetical protein